MNSQPLKRSKNNTPPKRKLDKRQTVTIRKKTVVQAYSQEHELEHLIDSGEWELLFQTPAFIKRSPEGQIHALTKAIDCRIRNLEKTLSYLINRGPKQRPAAMNLLHQMGRLRTLRDEALEKFYLSGQIAIPEEARTDKIDFF